MAVFDLIGVVALTASAATFIALMGRWYADGANGQRSLLFWHAAWFIVVVVLAAGVIQNFGVLGTPALGVTIILPLLAVVVSAAREGRVRNALLAVPLTSLIAVNALRVLGVFFIMLQADGRLPAPFAPSAGWGDIVIGATALPVALLARRRVAGWRAVVMLWNCLGALDLVSAIFLGVTSAEGSPLRLFYGEPNTQIMTHLPWMLIPAFLVPNLMLTHLAVFRALGVAPASPRSQPA